MTILGRAGDIVKCEDGHPLYKLRSDIESGAIIRSSMFEAIGDAQPPQAEAAIKNCHICGKPWIKKGPNGGFLPVMIESQ
jgi:hypothetical protein